MKSTIAMTLGLFLLASGSYGGVTINGTTIIFDDATTQDSAAPADHGGVISDAAGANSFVGGGLNNVANGSYGSIGGGKFNSDGVFGATFHTIGGGYANLTTGDYSTIGGGEGNYASATHSTISGGSDNTASGKYSVVGGGGKFLEGNEAMGDYSVVVGGYDNLASGKGSVVSGGRANVASGDASWAGGTVAIASHNGSFVWGGWYGGSSDDFDTFNVYASGGIFLNGTVEHTSDRNIKEAFSFVSAREVLDKVVEMPVSTWRFKTEEDTVRHIGPMAQDFMAAFGYGRDDRYITATDADGVALAAIQGLYAMLEDQAEVNTALRWHNEQLKAMLRSRDESLEARFARLEKAILRERPRVPASSTD